MKEVIKYKIFNRADGRDGHFSVSRFVKEDGISYWECWDGKGWSKRPKIYYDYGEAVGKLKLLEFRASVQTREAA